ncbi:MAG: hypothetical protein PWQ22_827 [Archaeoglobaceae archaeon]|nr:hypothetical protein [Archaeoglobaceae archaeon]MDK2876417.1 hypothetical protein [Archaeoglobaceae archaeon]
MRPLGVILISVLLLLNAVIGILSGLGMVLLREELFPIIQTEFEEVAKGYELPQGIVGEVYDLVSIVIIALGLIFFLSAVGLFMLKNWARILTIFLFVFQLVYSSLLLVYDPFGIINVLIAISVIWYLLRKDVKEKFEGRKVSIEERILGQKS